MNENKNLSSIALANIEALAQNESNTKNKGEATERTETSTITVKETSEQGYTWSHKTGVWLYYGEVTSKPPTYSWETTKTITDKYNCCRGGYDKDCDHIMCESN